MTKAQFQQVVNVAFTLLYALGQRRNLTHYFAFKAKLEKTIDFKLEESDYKKILRDVNILSWEQHGCLFSSLILCGYNLPGWPLFKMAWRLGAINMLPNRDDINSWIDHALALHLGVYAGVKSHAKETEVSNQKLKVPNLF